MGCHVRQLRAALQIPRLRDVPADEPAFRVHRRVAAGAATLLYARRHARGAGLVSGRGARRRALEAVYLDLILDPAAAFGRAITESPFTGAKSLLSWGISRFAGP